MIRLPANLETAVRLAWALKIRDVGDRIAAGEQFFWGGQLVTDAKDYYKIADLVAAGKLEEARSHYRSLDTAARDPMHTDANDAYSAIFKVT